MRGVSFYWTARLNTGEHTCTCRRVAMLTAPAICGQRSKPSYESNFPTPEKSTNTLASLLVSLLSRFWGPSSSVTLCRAKTLEAEGEQADLAAHKSAEWYWHIRQSDILSCIKPSISWNLHFQAQKSIPVVSHSCTMNWRI